MSSPDAAPAIHQPLQDQLVVARLELTDISDGLWQAASYNRDVIQEALDAFPEPAQRRADTVFSCGPEEEARLRAKAALLGPGRRETESLQDLGIYHADAEVIEAGQLHKVVTELWRSLISGQRSPIIVFGSDRSIPLWSKDKEGEQVDTERLSSDRLLVISGQGLAQSDTFFYEAGKFDAKTEVQDVAADEIVKDRSLTLPANEYEMIEKFLGGSLDDISDSVMDIGYDPEDGQVSRDRTGQIRRLGSISGRDIILVHKEKRQDESTLDTTDTILLMGSIATAVTATPESIIGYWTGAAYKPSRWMSGIRAAIKATSAGVKLRVAVPSYGYADLSKIKGEDPKPPTIQNIASEMGKTAEEALKLREFLDSFNQ